MNPYDPYWAVALADGRWYLADTAETKLMGQYTDEEDTGNNGVELVALLDLSKPYKRMFDLNNLINKNAS